MSKWAATYLIKRAAGLGSFGPTGPLETAGRIGNQVAGAGLGGLGSILDTLGANNVGKSLMSKGTQLRGMGQGVTMARAGANEGNRELTSALAQQAQSRRAYELEKEIHRAQYGNIVNAPNPEAAAIHTQFKAERAPTFNAAAKGIGDSASAVQGADRKATTHADSAAKGTQDLRSSGKKTIAAGAGTAAVAGGGATAIALGASKKKKDDGEKKEPKEESKKEASTKDGGG